MTEQPRTSKCMCIYIYADMHVFFIKKYVYAHVYVYAYVYVYVYVYVYMYVCIT